MLQLRTIFINVCHLKTFINLLVNKMSYFPELKATCHFVQPTVINKYIYSVYNDIKLDFWVINDSKAQSVCSEIKTSNTFFKSNKSLVPPVSGVETSGVNRNSYYCNEVSLTVLEEERSVALTRSLSLLPLELQLSLSLLLLTLPRSLLVLLQRERHRSNIKKLFIRFYSETPARKCWVSLQAN